MLCSAVLLYAVPCRAVPCRAVLCSTVLCGVSPFYCILVLLCCTVLFPAVSYRAQLLYCAVLCCAVPCRAVPCRAVLCSCHTRIYFYCHPILREPYLSGFLTLAFVFVCLFVHKQHPQLDTSGCFLNTWMRLDVCKTGNQINLNLTIPDHISDHENFHPPFIIINIINF